MRIVMSRDKIEMMILKFKIIYLFKNLIYYIKRSRRKKKRKRIVIKNSYFQYKSSER